MPSRAPSITMRRIRDLLLYALAMAGLLIQPASARGGVADGAQDFALAPAQADDDLARGWNTLAHADEIQALAVDPGDPYRVMTASEGGGVVEWILDGFPEPSWDMAPRSVRHFTRPATPGLGSNTVHDIAFSPYDGSIWLATERGVTRAPADLASGGWRTWVEELGMPEGRVFSAVTVGRDGTVWAGTPELGLATRSPSGIWSTADVDDLALDGEEVREGPGAAAVSDLLFDAEGVLWVAHGRSGDPRLAASRFFPATGEWRHLLAGGPRTDPSEGPRTGQLMKLALDRSRGELWIASWGRGVYRFDGERWAEFGVESGVCDTTVWAIAARDGAVWAACGESARELGGGVARYDGETWKTFTTAEGLPTDVVTAIGLAGRTVLLGTDGPSTRAPWTAVGVQMVRSAGEGIDIGLQLRTRDLPAVPPANEITALAVDGDGAIWAGTRDAGLLWRPSNAAPWRATRFADGLAGDTITDIALAGDVAWITATSTRFEGGVYADGGLSAVDRADPGRILVTVRPAPDGRPSGQLSSVAPLADGRIAVGLGAAAGSPGRDPHDGRGLAVFDPVAETWEYFDYAWTAGGLAGDTVMDLRAAGGSLWAATSYFRDASRELRPAGGGVSAWDGAAWRAWGAGTDGFTAYAEDLISGDVRALEAASDGSIWAGTWTADEGSLIGLWPFVDAVAQRFDGERWQAETFPGQGWVSAIAEDRAGRVWAATTRGHGQETWPARGVRGDEAEGFDVADGGLRVGAGSAWLSLHEGNSGVGARSVSALAVDPTTGDLWAGSESGGLLVRDAEGLDPTPMPVPTRDPSRIRATLYLPKVSR